MDCKARAKKLLHNITCISFDAPMDEVRLVQSGVSTALYESSLESLGVDPKELSWIITARTLAHRKSVGKPLTQIESERWLRYLKVRAMAEVVFGSSEKASLWMIKTHSQFDGQNAAAIVQTEAGARMLEDVLVQIDFGITA